MALINNIAGAVILGAKANEHGSAVGKTPPTILYIEQGDLASELAAAKAARAAIIALQVPNSFAGMSLRPSFDAMGAVPSFVEAGSNDNWPEANTNRTAKVLLADASGKAVYSMRIPYVADNKTDANVAADLAALLAAHNFLQAGVPVSGGQPATLTRVLQVQIVSR